MATPEMKNIGVEILDFLQKHPVNGYIATEIIS